LLQNQNYDLAANRPLLDFDFAMVMAHRRTPNSAHCQAAAGIIIEVFCRAEDLNNSLNH
jgi:hypothetical protein